MAKPRGKHILIRPELREGETKRVNNHWRVLFLDHLAESSNVTESAAKAGISVSRAYKVRREEPAFATLWLAALWEGYTHLEMEVVRRLRQGDHSTLDAGRYDFANAIRLLAAHRDTASQAMAQQRNVSAAEVRASIDRKVEEIRLRLKHERARADGAR
ncbi:hypothetical protein FHS52_000792 [Erythromicrobium ramosum]|uniref:Uncharacterized protein n=1 Tax=Erythrobacter ramosus TaxID=35811 RepID=A0A6I4UF34_9SPHN|nr:hypothetical protein [Erythrobacter ramosus]MBB3774849.1 hypothetical protein [Erythrobacter ramosus]MXP37510.1 hypothetical protein [Erythrobacter ramosus]